MSAYVPARAVQQQWHNATACACTIIVLVGQCHEILSCNRLILFFIHLGCFFFHKEQV